MLTSKSSKKTLTLVLFIGLALALTAEASSHAPVVRRDHSNIKRIVKKRSPFPQTATAKENAPTGGLFPPLLNGAGSDPNTSATATTGSASSTASAPESKSTSATSSEPSSVSSSSSTASESSSSVSSSSSASSTASVSETTSATSTTLEVAKTPEATPPVQPVLQTEVAPPSKSTITSTATVTGEPQASDTNSITGAAAADNSKPKTSTVLTIIIAVAASVGGVFLLWTIFRKWKLGRSKAFDERLQPIDWQPTSHEDDIIPPNRRLSGASFRSGRTGYGATSDAGHGHGSLNPLPDHDFTAGGGHLAPVGGYADLARGPSPTPQMSESLHRGPSTTRAYDVGVPLHHQTGYNTAQENYRY